MTHRDVEETNMIGRGPRELCRSVPRGGAYGRHSVPPGSICFFFFLKKKKKGIGRSKGPRE